MASKNHILNFHIMDCKQNDFIFVKFFLYNNAIRNLKEPFILHEKYKLFMSDVLMFIKYMKVTGFLNDDVR